MLFATAAALRDEPAGIAALPRLAGAVMQAAMNVSAETSGTNNYANRQKWCNQVCASPDATFQMARQMFMAVVLTTAIAAKLDASQPLQDSDLLTAVESLVNLYAGQV